MKPTLVADIARRMGGSFQGNADLEATGFATDSASVRAGDLFLAIKGARADGHNFVDEAIANGCVAAIVERSVDAPHILVPHLVDALSGLGKSWRDEFTAPVVGITGSNGKTTTKELTAAALSPLGPVLKSPGNKNTEYTSPLVWAEAEGQTSAVIEMAMRGFGQIAHLAQIHRPEIAIITGIGTAHVEMVGSREGIAKAKGELLDSLPTDGLAILPIDDDFFPELRQRAPGRVMTFGFNPDADCQIMGYRALDWRKCVVRWRIGNEEAEQELDALGRHNALNAAAALLASHSLGVSLDKSAAALSLTEWPPMRMEIRQIAGVTYVVDTYNASPDSTVAALRAMAELPISGRRIAVLGEMRELGQFQESGHRMVGRALVETDPDLTYLTGGPTRFIADEAQRAGYSSARMVEDAELNLLAIQQYLSATVQPGDVVLIKASRALGLEKVLEPAESL
ncbi:MAG: UDP-N-acetylmuramoyl-tripeptide--D-alanyl-D-alanine ligase [Fimbriimonadaceae bacterium]|nr:UDP-N-acetylmuramoyl-tripeptide--D-alanyl-D-alanine ligase [Fimbriimonadaceae bacterium]